MQGAVGNAVDEVVCVSISRARIADTSTIDAYVEEHKAESKRIALERPNRRDTNENALADIQTRITRVIEQVSKGTINEDEVLAVLPCLNTARTHLQAELRLEEPTTNINELKPKAVETFRKDVEQIVEIVNSSGGKPSIELGKAFGNVVSSVIVHHGYRVKISI